jgi:hypothetical protein
VANARHDGRAPPATRALKEVHEALVTACAAWPLSLSQGDVAWGAAAPARRPRLELLPVAGGAHVGRGRADERYVLPRVAHPADAFVIRRVGHGVVRTTRSGEGARAAARQFVDERAGLARKTRSRDEALSAPALYEARSRFIQKLHTVRLWTTSSERPRTGGIVNSAKLHVSERRRTKTDASREAF